MPRLPPQIGRRSRAGINRGAGIHALTPVISAAEGIADGVTWDGRSSGAYHEQPDGTIVEVLPGELRVEGARRVSSVFNNIGPYYGGQGDVTENIADPNGGRNAARVITNSHATKPSGLIFETLGNWFAGNNGELAWFAVWLRADVSVRAVIGVGSHGNGKNVTIETGWKLFAKRASQHSSTFRRFGVVVSSAANTSIEFEYYAPYGEKDYGHTAPNTPTYYAADYGFGALGVRYLTHENGNTVDANGVVTEAKGPVLPKPFWLLLEPEEINDYPDPLDPTKEFMSGSAVSTMHSTIKSPSGKLDSVHIASGSPSTNYKARAFATAEGATKQIWARTVSGVGSVALIDYYGSGNLFDLTEEWQALTIEDDAYIGAGSGNFYLADLRAGSLTEVLVWFPHIKAGGGKITGLVNGARTADGAMRISNVPANALPYVDHINTDDKRILNTGRDNEIASYDSPSDTLIVGGDTAKTRRIASVKYDN